MRPGIRAEGVRDVVYNRTIKQDILRTSEQLGQFNMAEIISCYRCGASLEKLSLPLSRRDECPACTVHVHVCRMCIYFDPSATKQCLEDDAEEVLDKIKVNFCEWFKPSAAAFDPVRADKEARARADLASLFSAEPATKPAADPASQRAEDLFKR